MEYLKDFTISQLTMNDGKTRKAKHTREDHRRGQYGIIGNRDSKGRLMKK